MSKLPLGIRVVTNTGHFGRIIRGMTPASVGVSFDVGTPGSVAVGNSFTLEGKQRFPAPGKATVIYPLAIVNTSKPLEAVELATGRTVPMIYDRSDRGSISGGFYTKDAPCSNTSNAGWEADGRDYCGQKRWIIRNVETPVSELGKPRSSTLDLTKNLQTRAGIPVKLEGVLRDTRLVVVIHGATKIVAADGRVHRNRMIESADDIINVPAVVKTWVFNVYADGNVGKTAHPSITVAQQRSKYDKTRIGYLVQTVADGKVTSARVYPTEPLLRTAANPTGTNPFA